MEINRAEQIGVLFNPIEINEKEESSMKKMLSVLLALAMVFSLSCTAFAVEEVEYEPSTEETIITPRSSLSLSFTSLQTNSKSITGALQYEVK